MTLFRIVDRETQHPVGVASSDKVERGFSRVAAIAALVSVDKLRAYLAEKRPLLVCVADVDIAPVVDGEPESQSAPELRGAEAPFVPVEDGNALALTATDLVAGFDHPDVVVGHSYIGGPVDTEVPENWCAALDVARPARLVVAFDVDDVCLGVALSQLVKPQRVLGYLSLEVVLPLWVTSMLRKSVEVRDVAG